MATKTQEQLTVVCDGLFLNDTKPQEWTQTFPWEPSIGFHYRLLDENGEPIGEIEKKYLKKKFIWMFQAMGGRNAVGRYFRVEAEHGEIPAKDGKPSKPYTTITPLAEVFSNGTARFLEAPKEGKVNTPGPAEKPKGPVVPAGKNINPQGVGAKPSGPVAPKPASPTPPADPKKPRPKPNEKFIATCFESGTNQFFRMQDGFTEDGWILNQAHDHAKDMVLNQLGWKNHINVQSTEEGKDLSKCVVSDDTYKAELAKWADYFEWYYSQKRWAKTVNRLKSILANLKTMEQVIALVEMAWAKLPLSFYEQVTEEARVRIDHLEDAPPPGNHVPTATPEVPEPGLKPFTEEELGEEEETGLPPEAFLPLATPVAPDEQEIVFTVRGINNLTDYEKLLDFWNTTKPALQAVESVRQAMRLWIADYFMRSKYQNNVDGMLDKFPKGLITAELKKTLDDRYSKLATF